MGIKVEEEGRKKSAKQGGAAQPELESGRVLSGNYEIVGQVGQGGMATVYKAVQKSLDRVVALKVLLPRFALDKEFIQRFEAESGALASLSHPNIVGIIDRGTEDDLYYFVMEYVDGKTLDDKIIDKSLTPPDWKNIVAGCSAALEYIHKRRVVHRDIKPSNILMDSEGLVKIGDFGIVHIVEGDQDFADARRSRPMGTQYYMAPEQTHDPANVDHRADIYSLGVTFYKMFTRRLPSGEFSAPSDLNKDVPVAVDSVILQAMAPDREERFATAKEFCNALLEALRDKKLNISSGMKLKKAGGKSSLYTGDDFRSPLSTHTPVGQSAKPQSGKGAPTGSGAGTGSGTGTGTGTGRWRTTKRPSAPGTGTGRGLLGASLTPSTRSGREITGAGGKTGVGDETSWTADAASTGTGRSGPTETQTGGTTRCGDTATPKPSASPITANDRPKKRGGKALFIVTLCFLLAAGVGAAVYSGIIPMGPSSAPTPPRPPANTAGEVEDGEESLTTGISPAQEREERLRRIREEQQQALLDGEGILYVTDEEEDVGTGANTPQ